MLLVSYLHVYCDMTVLCTESDLAKLPSDRKCLLAQKNLSSTVNIVLTEIQFKIIE
jgi:hypothetical protein